MPDFFDNAGILADGFSGEPEIRVDSPSKPTDPAKIDLKTGFEELGKAIRLARQGTKPQLAPVRTPKHN